MANLTDAFDTVLRLKTGGLSYADIATHLNGCGFTSLSGTQWTRDSTRNFWRRQVQPHSNAAAVDDDRVPVPGVTESTISPVERFSGVVAKHIENDAGNVLIVGDIHEPFSVEGYAEWCRETADRWGADRVVFIGDIVDNYASSMHQKDIDVPGALDEYENAAARLGKWFKLFPDAVLTLGNHDDRPLRTAKAGGVSSVFLKSFRQTWDIPDKWVITQNAVLDGVFYTHQGGGGASPSLSLALSKLMPCVTGHYHTVGGVKYHAGENHTLWGLDVGCGVDRTGYGLAYNRSLSGYVLGCGFVINDGRVKSPHFIPFSG